MHPLLATLRNNDACEQTQSVQNHGAVISNTFFRMHLESAQTSAFKAEFRTLDLGPLKLFACHTNAPLVGVRTYTDIVNDANQNHCLIYLPVEMSGGESSWHYQGGKESRGGERIITMVDGCKDYRVHRPEFLGITLIVPHALLQSRLAKIQPYCIVPHDASVGSFALAWDFIMSVWFNQNTLGEQTKLASANTIVELLAHAFESEGQTRMPGDSSVRVAYLHKAIDYIDAHLADRCIRPEDVAQHLGIKKRYLYDIFAENDKSLHTLVRDKRLERCHSTLKDISMSTLSITEIAFRWGFSSNAHFSRVFKKKYGVAPRVYRQAITAASVSK
ncbi:MAG: helix-turn-helix domain-containing protein [Halioglobus sp.]